MRVWLIYMTGLRQYMGMVFMSKEAAELYRTRFGNPTWEIEEMFAHDTALVAELSDI